MRSKVQIWMVALATCAMLALAASPASAWIVHHCDYSPGAHANEPTGGGCTNEDSSGATYTGHCDHSNGFFWADSDCIADPTTGLTTCNMSGIVNCGAAGNKSYNLTCTGPTGDTSAAAGRTTAICAGGENSLQTCTCSPGGNCN